jgi:hypothetical protein
VYVRRLSARLSPQFAIQNQFNPAVIPFAAPFVQLALGRIGKTQSAGLESKIIIGTVLTIAFLFLREAYKLIGYGGPQSFRKFEARRRTTATAEEDSL